LADRVVQLGHAAETGGHLHSGLELYQTAYEIAAATGAVSTAVDAARFSGRILRRLARWSEAHRWYGVARGIAEAAGMEASVAVILDGVSNTYLERGNLPEARTARVDALRYAERSGDSQALGNVCHGFMTLEQASGNLDQALEYGWRAVMAHDRTDGRVHALAGLGGTLVEMGELDAAEDAWTIVSVMAEDDYYLLYAFDALAYIGALRGDRAAFAAHAAKADAMGWMTGSAAAKAEILLYRGLSYAALADVSTARSWFERAVAFAEERGFSQVLFRAEESLRELESAQAPTEVPEEWSPARVEVRTGMSALRQEWAATPS